MIRPYVKPKQVKIHFRCKINEYVKPKYRERT